MLGEILYVMSCPIWVHDGKPLYKIGSTHNLIARRKNAKTWASKKISIKGFYLLKNCASVGIDCYKMDNLIKFHFNKYRIKEPGGGTEFYVQFDLKELSDLIKSFNLEHDWIDEIDETTEPNNKEICDDIVDQYNHDDYDSFLKKYKPGIVLMRINNTKSGNKWMYDNYKNSVINGFSEDRLAKYKPDIFNAGSKKHIPIWGRKTGKTNNNYATGDYIFFVANDGNSEFIDIYRIGEHITDSPGMSMELYGEECYSEFFVLIKHKKETISKESFLKKIDKSPNWKLVGAPMINRATYNDYIYKLIQNDD